ncbi:hypothetical protein B0H19DRAFT_1132224 [Mycena capillaripes]|nr:hypothetical protein B0H19DRAFT_1132224 [Mycena capillaripes]
MSMSYNPVYVPSDAYPAEPLSARIAASKPESQLQSPLFATLYPELRNMVFTHALTEYDDHSRPYSKHAFYHRPGFEFTGKIDTSLLLTCRVIYLETHLAPISLNEHVFWMYRGPPRFTDDDEHFEEYFAKMTPQQRGAVRQVRLITQLFWLEGRRVQEWAAGLNLSKLVITIRHSDWWYWEDGDDLRINEPGSEWGAWVGSMPGLQEVELEFETIDGKREQLEERVRVALEWKFPTANDGFLVHDGKEPVKSTWLGSSRMSPGQGYDSDEEEEDNYSDEEYYDYSNSSDDESEHEEEENAQDSISHGGPEENEALVDEQSAQLMEPEVEGTVEDTAQQEEVLETEVEEATAETPVSSHQLEDAATEDRTEETEELDPEAKLDLRFTMNLTLHVRRFKFVHESRLV